MLADALACSPAVREACVCLVVLNHLLCSCRLPFPSVLAEHPTHTGTTVSVCFYGFHTYLAPRYPRCPTRCAWPLRRLQVRPRLWASGSMLEGTWAMLSVV